MIPAQVYYLHQVYNFAILKYDPALLGDTIVKDIVISDQRIMQNDSVYLVCMSKSYQPMVRKTIVSNIRQFFISEPTPPSYRSMNVEGIEVTNMLILARKSYPKRRSNRKQIGRDSGTVSGIYKTQCKAAV